MFRTVPLSIIRSFSLYTQQWYMSYRLQLQFASRIRKELSSSVQSRSCSQACQQTCVTYTIGVCTVKNSWWWTEEVSETCRVLFQKLIWEISASSWFYYRNLSRRTITWTPNFCLFYRNCYSRPFTARISCFRTQNFEFAHKIHSYVRTVFTVNNIYFSKHH